MPITIPANIELAKRFLPIKPVLFFRFCFVFIYLLNNYCSICSQVLFDNSLKNIDGFQEGNISKEEIENKITQHAQDYHFAAAQDVTGVFYKSECALCGSQMLSVYNSENPSVVYCHECWFSDKWDVMSYGRDYVFSKPFFTQFQSLRLSVPQANLCRDNFILSEYCNYGLDFKDCY